MDKAHHKEAGGKSKHSEDIQVNNDYIAQLSAQGAPYTTVHTSLGGHWALSRQVCEISSRFASKNHLSGAYLRLLDVIFTVASSTPGGAKTCFTKFLRFPVFLECVP